jgi:hypothetical protein
MKECSISKGKRLGLLAAAWGIACIASVVAGRVSTLEDFVNAAFLFPLATWWFVEVPWAHPVVGWLLYISITIAAAYTRKPVRYFVLYGVVCILLIMNVVGCHKAPPPDSNLM